MDELISDTEQLKGKKKKERNPKPLNALFKSCIEHCLTGLQVDDSHLLRDVKLGVADQMRKGDWAKCSVQA